MGVLVGVGVGGGSVGVAVGRSGAGVAVISSMTGGGGGVLVGGTAVLMTGWPRVGSGATAVSAVVSPLWQATKKSSVKLKNKMMNLRIDNSIIKPFAAQGDGIGRRVKELNKIARKYSTGPPCFGDAT